MLLVLMRGADEVGFVDERFDGRRGLRTSEGCAEVGRVQPVQGGQTVHAAKSGLVGSRRLGRQQSLQRFGVPGRYFALGREAKGPLRASTKMREQSI